MGCCSNKNLCLVEATQEYLKVRGLAEGWLFCHKGGALLTRHQFWVVTSKALTCIDLCDIRFGTLYFKTEAASTAVDTGHVQQLGRWQPFAFKSYIQPVKF